MSRADYQEVLEIFQEAQLKQADNPAEFAANSSKAGRAARELGYLSLAEQAQRNAIQSYTNVRLETEGSEAPIDHKTLWEYEQLALTFYELPKTVWNAHKIHSLKREVRQLGPVAAENVIQGLTALSETERGLSYIACSRLLRTRHWDKHTLLESVISAGLHGNGLGVRIMANDNLEPRPIGQWARDLAPNIPGGIVSAPAFTTD